MAGGPQRVPGKSNPPGHRKAPRRFSPTAAGTRVMSPSSVIKGFRAEADEPKGRSECPANQH